MLLQRAQVIARLRHPNLVRMLPLPGGAGLTPVPGNARRLADFILPTQTFRRFELPHVLCLLLDVLSGLTALHELKLDGVGFVHGEVSPRHIYVDEHGTGRLVPLVSAHLMPKPHLESTGYVAPERLLGKQVDARADVFSVGVMLWEALAGEQLFPNISADAVLALALGGKLPPLTARAGAAWTKPLCEIAERAIATDPEQRFGSALELSNAIAQAARRELSQVRGDDWQDEAPTPVFMPRIHLAPARGASAGSSASAGSATAGNGAPRNAPVTRSATPPATVVEVAPEEATTSVSPKEPQRRAGRSRAAILGLASASIVAIGWLMPSLSQPSRAPFMTLPTEPRSPAAAPPPAAPPLAEPAPTAPPSTTVVAPAAAPSSSAAPLPIPRRPRATTPRPARHEPDYGI
jgi:serine/threonine-protein kinase